MTIWREIWHRARRGLEAGVEAPPKTSVTLETKDPLMVERLDGFPSKLLHARRTVRVFLPVGYQGAQGKRYPVLYLNDGQDAESLNLAGTLARLQETGAIPPVVVVAVHATGERLREYGTSGVPNTQGLGDLAAQYERFIFEELMPYVEGHYPLLTGPLATTIAGLSLGGLSAFDLAWRHPDRFGAVGVMSGSFWWRTNDRTPATKQASRIMHARIRETPGRPALRMWFETGTGDESADRDGDGVIDSIQDTDELVNELLRKGYASGRDVKHVTLAGGHNLSTWRSALPGMLEWLYSTAPYSRDITGRLINS